MGINEILLQLQHSCHWMAGINGIRAYNVNHWN